MTSVFNKTISGDFTLGLDARQFHDEVDASSIVPVLQAVDVTGDNVIITFDSGLSGPEETTLDGLISSHVPSNINQIRFNNWIPMSEHPHGVYYTTYTEINNYRFPGTDRVQTVDKIEVYAWKDTAVTNFDVRIYDSTNHNVIAELTNQTNTDELAHLDMGTLSNLSSSPVSLELQIKKNGGGTNDDRCYSKGYNIVY